MMRRNAEAAQAIKLKEILEKRRGLMAELQDIRREIESYDASLPEAGSAADMLSARRYGETLFRRADLLQAELRKNSTRESEQRKVLLGALKERKKMDKLKEMWEFKRAKAFARVEASEMDETARVQYVREAA